MILRSLFMATLLTSISIPALAVFNCKDLTENSGPVDFHAELTGKIEREYFASILEVSHVKFGPGYVVLNPENNAGLVFDQNGSPDGRSHRTENVQESDLILRLTNGAFTNQQKNLAFKSYRGLIQGMRLQKGKIIYEAKGVFKNGDVLLYSYEPESKPLRLSYIDAMNGMQAYAAPILKHLEPGTHFPYLNSDSGFESILRIDGLLVTITQNSGWAKKVVPASDFNTRGVAVVELRR